MKSKKKALCLFLTMLLLTCAITPVIASDNIKVRIGGEPVLFDVQPQIINDRTMVPLRAIFEALGATVDWNGETQTVTSTKGDTTIKLTINNPTMYVNEETVTLDSPACLVEGRTLVPVRAISEAFNLKVEWVASTKTVKIKKEVSLISEVDEGYRRTIYTYTDDGKLLEREETFLPVGRVTKYKYEYDGDYLVSITSDNGSWANYSYDENGLNTLISEPNEVWAKMTYDSKGNLIKYESTGGFWVIYEYNEKGVLINTKSTFDPNGYVNEYDERGNVILRNFIDQDGNFSSWSKYEYDLNNNLVYETHGYYEGSEDISWNKYEYDEKGNLILQSDCYGNFTKYDYDSNGNLIFQSDNFGTFTKYIVVEM